MNYQLTIAIKQRKCNMCSDHIEKGTKLFVMSDWPRGADFPTKKNICLNCAPKLTQPEFIGYLKALLKELEHLETLQQTIVTKQDLTKTYICKDCNSKVEYNEVFERYKCLNPDCDQIYEIEDVTYLEPWRS